MNDDHTDIDELLPGYVLGALDTAEQARVRRHVESCPACWQMAESDRIAVEHLAFAVPPQRPPSHLKAGMIGRIVLEGAGTPAPAQGQYPVPARRVPGWMVAAALVPWILVAGLGAEMMMSGTGKSTPTPAMTVARLSGKHGAFGQMAMTKNGTSALLTVTRLPALPPHMMYVCWLERQGTMEPVKGFYSTSNANDAIVMLRAPQPLGDYSEVGISMETISRPPRPTGTLLAVGKL